MRKLFLFLLPLILFAPAAQAQEETITSVNMAFSPTAPQSTANKLFTFSVTVTRAGGTPVTTGGVYIDRIVDSSNSNNVIYRNTDADLTVSDTTAVDSAGSAVLAYTINTAGTYAVDIGYLQRDGLGPLVHSAAFSVTVAAAEAAAEPGSGAAVTPATPTDGISIPNPIKCNNASCLISQIIRAILGIIAIIATIMFVWGGVMMLTSGGNEKRVTQARETLVWAAIGLVVIIISWAVIKFVLTAVINGGAKST